VVLARWPAPLRCKSRLAAGVGSTRAAAVQRRLSGHVLQVAAEAVSLSCREANLPAAELVLAASGLGPQAARRWGQGLGADRTVLQGRGGLGLRLQRQLRRARREGATRVVLIGSDLPELATTDLLLALDLLGRHPLVLGPAVDGGYWLIGLGGLWPALFAGRDSAIPWGGDQVLAQTLAVARDLGLEAALLPLRSDLDHASDLVRWR
jgi:hypothetical protein